MKKLHQIFLLSMFVFLFISNNTFAQKTFVGNIVEFEVKSGEKESLSLVNTLLNNVFTTQNNFEKILDYGTKNKLIKIYFHKSEAVSSEKSFSLASEGTLELINNKKIKIGEVSKLTCQITPYLLDEDNPNPLVRTDLFFERNEIDKSLPAGERYVSLDTHRYKTSLNNRFGQVTIMSAGQTKEGNTHFLGLYYTK